MWIRRLIKQGDSWAVTVPVNVRRQPPWVGARHVQIEWRPPHLIVTPLTVEQLLERPREEGEDLIDDAIPDRQP